MTESANREVGSKMLRVLVLAAAVLAVVLIASSLDTPRTALAGEGSLSGPLATNTCSAETPRDDCGSAMPNPQDSSAEAELAEKYAPIVYVKEQEEDCDRDGEAYVPAEVGIVLDNPDIALMLSDGQKAEVVMMAPSGSDLFDKGEGYYLDYPGNPRQPRCEYEEAFKALRLDYADVAYANIQRQPGHPGFVLQYWLFYYFNDWNNTHEADWEMIQLVFEAETVEEALQQEPVRVGYSQHESGESADWDDDKLQKEDGRPVVYVARGGHPSQFDDAIYFGLGEDGAGFGCDDTSSPSVRVELEARLIPNEVSGPDDPFAWIEYEGQWGQKDEGFWNGPEGPKTKSKWHEPFTWEEDLRKSAVKVPGGDTLAPNAIQGFCRVISFGSRLLNAFTRAPVAVVGAGGLVFLLLVGIVQLGRTTGLRGARPLAAGADTSAPLRRERDLRHILRAAASIYRQNWPALLLIGAFYIPVGWVTTGLHSVISNNPPMEPVWRLVSEFPATEIVMTMFLGSVQAAIAAIIVNGAVVAALGEIDAGARGSARVAYRKVWHRLGSLFGAYLRATFHIVLYALTIVGIPWAIQRAVRWYFLPQTIMLEDKHAKESLSASADVVAGSWWRAFCITFFLGLIGILAGPSIAIFFLLFFSASVTFVNLISTVIFVILIPFIATALTLLYYDLQAREAEPASKEEQAPDVEAGSDA